MVAKYKCRCMSCHVPILQEISNTIINHQNNHQPWLHQQQPPPPWRKTSTMKSPKSAQRVCLLPFPPSTTYNQLVRNLQSHRRFLSSSLLTSTHLQNRLNQLSQTDQTTVISPLVTAAGKHSETNHHRIAFTATTFPFTDPDPTLNGANNLLGVRIDICGRNGRYSKPYYLLLKKVPGKGTKRVRIHRHTIPGFISVADLERTYLPVPRAGPGGEEEEELKPWKMKQRTRQDLRGLVRELRKELVAWHLRSDALDLLRERLGFEHDGEQILAGNADALAGPLGIVSLSSMGLDARYFRIQWQDGRIGRLRISNTGTVMRAVVIKDRGRDKLMEVAMMGGDARVESLLERLVEYTSSSG